jgi:hypothetical protein
VPFDNKFKGGKDLLYTLTSSEKLRCWVRDKELVCSPKDDGHDGGPQVKLGLVDASGERHEKRFRCRVDEYLALKEE